MNLSRVRFWFWLLILIVAPFACFGAIGHLILTGTYIGFPIVLCSVIAFYFGYSYFVNPV